MYELDKRTVKKEKNVNRAEKGKNNGDERVNIKYER